MNNAEICFLSEDGEIEIVSLEAVSSKLKTNNILVCHAPYTAKKLGLKQLPRFDILELYAFIYPTKFAVPTINGIAKALGITPSNDIEEQAMLVHEIIEHLTNPTHLKSIKDIESILNFMAYQGQGWAWAPILLEQLGKQVSNISIKDLALWEKRPEWQDNLPPRGNYKNALNETAINDNLSLWLSSRSTRAEDRPQQRLYSQKIATAFKETNIGTNTHILLAEAGTGVGKSLGYLNPAWLWANQNDNQVWVSTYTKNLQKQLESELDGLIPRQQDEHDTLVIRKGRENYLCLLNLEEQVRTTQLAEKPNDRIAAGIMLRWMQETKDGDFSGSSFHGWLPTLLGYQQTLGLSDSRGECIYAACDHYKKCFIEHAVAKAKNAKIVLSNHALSMIQASIAVNPVELPSRYIFDEGHHLFDAADSTFASNLTLLEMLELRRWLLGAETGRKTRSRGLRKRLEGLIEDNSKAEDCVVAAIRAAHQLPNYQILSALKKGGHGERMNACETFFLSLRDHIKQQIHNNNATQGLYGSECAPYPVPSSIIALALHAQNTLSDIRRHLLKLIDILLKKAEQERLNETPDATEINRLENLTTSLQRRCDNNLTPWISMLSQLETPPGQDFIDWFGIDRAEGKDSDVGMYRRWVDPMIPFASTLQSHAEGIAITSATLRDSQHENEGWETALEQTGARHFKDKGQTETFYTPSPFDYKSKSKIFIVNDLPKNNLSLLGKAYADLMIASGGGALGIFTAIQRLRSLHPQIETALTKANIPLYAQHVDDMDVGTLIDLFKDQQQSCLLGTDAVRDGVDVPGEALRMIIFERVPWPRPTILHKARRQHFGGRAYDERMTRLKLKQAYGRLIRSDQDRGVFIMLDTMFPSRLHDAFPDDVEIVKTSLADTIEQVEGFFNAD